MNDKSKTPALGCAIDAYNRGDYFDAAEMFENAARDADDESQALVAALNRIAAAMHLRFERGGRQSSINLMSQAMLALEDMKPSRGGIDTERLFDELTAYVEEVRASPRDQRDGLKHRGRLFLERRRAPKINRTRGKI
ncbi:MAG: hypothetical protein Q7S58_00490 [Candidatus Binatus sp.]|uniref:hypothetical protein n=1 Tax=Candidatus Binatus sp. TaxID=2811406 RepID=UPI00271FA808|nr:hypothetical protein [Candidatus Binatus sp.]MDO8430864.1 hypothetical protein [Candidatus Binatus sp.]